MMLPFWSPLCQCVIDIIIDLLDAHTFVWEEVKIAYLTAYAEGTALEKFAS